MPLIVDNTIADPVPDPADRARRRHRRALGDQVPRRARHHHRRRHRRRRHVRLRRARRSGSPASPSPTRATTACGTGRRSAPARTRIKARVQLLRDIGSAHRPAQRRSCSLQGMETLSPAHGAARRPTPRRWPSGWSSATRWRVVHYAGPAVQPVVRGGEEVPAAGRGRAWCRSSCAAASRRAQRFVDGLELFSHLANIGDVRSLVIHPASAPRTASSTPRSSSPPASRRAWCGCRWASRASTTSRPTSRPGSARRRRLMTVDMSAVSRRSPGPGRRETRPGAGSGSPLERPLRAGGRRRAARVDGRVRDLGARSTPTRSNAVLVLHALTGDSHVGRARRAGPPDARLVGRAHRAGPARWTPTAGSWSSPTCWAAARAATGPSSPAPDGRPWGRAFPS